MTIVPCTNKGLLMRDVFRNTNYHYSVASVAMSICRRAELTAESLSMLVLIFSLTQFQVI